MHTVPYVCIWILFAACCRAPPAGGGAPTRDGRAAGHAPTTDRVEMSRVDFTIQTLTLITTLTTLRTSYAANMELARC